MKTLIAYRKTSRLLTVLTVLISFTFMVTWLPVVRSIFDGSSYQWGLNFYGLGFSGEGITASLLFPIAQLLFYSALFISMFWVRKRQWFYGLLIAWYFMVFGNLLSDIAINGGTMFHGDTLNVHISLTWIVLPLSLLALVLIYFVIREDRKAEEPQIPWATKNRNLMFWILGPLVIQAILFSYGEPHGITDQIAVVWSILQSFLIPLILRPYASAPEISGAITN